jgi:hypothetical protein
VLPGTRLGVYEIILKVREGGTGEVFRARLAMAMPYHQESMPATRAVCLCVAAALFSCAAACAKATARSQPASGRVTVGLTSRGPGVEAMTFTVAIEPAGVEGSIKGDVGVFTADDTPAGGHVVRLKNLPGRCRVEGDPERRIVVNAGRSTTVRLVVVCT